MKTKTESKQGIANANLNDEKIIDIRGELAFCRFDETTPHFDAIKEIYDYSFPDEERKPFSMILEGQNSGKMELFYVCHNGEPAALIFIILGEPTDVLDYLAVGENFREHKIGSHILEWLQTYRKRPFLVEIETTLHEHAAQADRRKRFYLSSAMQDCHTEIKLFGVPMELMSWPKPVHYDDYEKVMSTYFEGNLSRYLSRYDQEN